MHNLLGSFDRESVPVDVPRKNIYPGADDSKHSSCVGNSHDNGLLEDFTSGILVINSNISQFD
jgi:hypothetical protein